MAGSSESERGVGLMLLSMPLLIFRCSRLFFPCCCASPLIGFVGGHVVGLLLFAWWWWYSLLSIVAHLPFASSISFGLVDAFFFRVFIWGVVSVFVVLRCPCQFVFSASGLEGIVDCRYTFWPT